MGQQPTCQEPITVTFQVKQEEWPALYSWLATLKWGQKSSRIRDILGEAARSAACRDDQPTAFPTPGQPSPPGQALQPVFPVKDGGESDANTAGHADGSQSSMDDIIASMVSQF